MADEIAKETLQTGIISESIKTRPPESLATFTDIPTLEPPRNFPPPRIPPPIPLVPTAAPRTLSLTPKMSNPIPNSHNNLDYEYPIYFCKTTQPHFCFTPFSQVSFLSLFLFPSDV